MTYKLLYHDESECLFWKDSEEITDDILSQCAELGEAPIPKRVNAEFMWSMKPNPKPAFNDVYDVKSEKGSVAVQAETVDAGQSAKQWLESVRWASGPQICGYENLPALPSEDALKKFLANGTESSALLGGTWLCPKCGMWHAKVIGIKCMSGTGSVNDKWVHYYKARGEREGLVPEMKPWAGSELWQSVFGSAPQKSIGVSQYIGKYTRDRKSSSAMEIPDTGKPAVAVEMPKRVKEGLW